MCDVRVCVYVRVRVCCVRWDVWYICDVRHCGQTRARRPSPMSGPTELPRNLHRPNDRPKKKEWMFTGNRNHVLRALRVLHTYIRTYGGGGVCTGPPHVTRHDERAGDAGDPGAAAGAGTDPAVDDDDGLRFFGLRAASGSEKDDGGNDGDSGALPLPPPPASASASLDGMLAAAEPNALKFVLPASASSE